MLQTVRSVAIRAAKAIFVLAALASFGINGYHYYEVHIDLEHAQYLGSGAMEIGGVPVELSIYKMRGVDEVYLSNRSKFGQRIEACMPLRDDGFDTVAVDVLSHRIEKTSPVRIQPYGLKEVVAKQ